MKSKLLTREILQNYGITEITCDGKVFMGEKELKHHLYSRKGKYKLQQPYALLVFSDKTKKRYYTNKKGYRTWTYNPITIPVSRAVYTWFHGEIPEGYEIDHIDTNTLNNNLNNLRLLTKEENLARKPISRNQYNYWKTDEEILKERENKKYMYDRTQHKIVKTDWWKEQETDMKVQKAVEKAQADILKTVWHSLNAQIKEKQAQRVAVDKKVDMDKWRMLGIEIDLLKVSLAETKKKMRK